MSARNEVPSDMNAWEHKVPMNRASSNLQALMETAPDGNEMPSLQSSDPIRSIVRKLIEGMSPEDQFAVEALWFEQVTIRDFAHRIGVSKTQAHRIKEKLATRIAALLLEETLIQERVTMQHPLVVPTTWQQAAVEALIVIGQNAAHAPEVPSFDKSMSNMEPYVNEGHQAVSILAVDDAILNIAIRAWLWLTEEDRDKMVPLIVSRQRKYGTGNIMKFETRGIIIRMSDKIERLRNMGGDFADDSVVDAYMDLVGYAVIHWMCAHDYFTLPLDPE